MEYAAHHGSNRAAYRLGKEYLKGEIVKRASAKAMEYLTQSAETGNQFAQYTLFQEQMPAPTVPGGIQIDRKQLAQLREKKIAMGHKPDDHEEPSQNWTMTMG